MENNRTLKRVAAVNDMSCFGKCSLTVTLPLLSHFGLEAVPLPTAILSTHTGGFTAPSCLDMTEEMKKIIRHWESIDLSFDCVYTGYLLGEKQIDIVKDFSLRHKAKGALMLIDPVMADNGRLYAGFSEAYAARMRELCHLADVVTPNVTEAALLAGMAYSETQSREFLRECAQRICDLGAKACVLTGARPNDSEIGDIAYIPEGDTWFEAYHPYVPRHMHGCGDVFASALCAALLEGRPLPDAVDEAARFTDDCIRETMKDADAHWYGLKFEPLLCPKATGAGK